ncbi:hypothetical protein F4802DRAFT_613228 [Xylaria palmicola]|nr:hypothetical protein F4802DRAFT_613228 [Xylaria palmicola]
MTDNAHPQDRPQGQGFHNMPLDIALEIADQLNSPEDIVNFALSCPQFLDYWIRFSENMQQRLPHEDDSESPLVQLPGETNPAGEAAFEGYSKVVMNRLFPAEIQRLILLILFMPNASDPIYDIAFRRQHPEVGETDPYALLFRRRRERFQKYYVGHEYRELLFTFRNLNRISPYCTAIEEFATDFAIKALSSHPLWAHHSAPFFAHGSLKLKHKLGQLAASTGDTSPIQSLDQLHETERERLKLAFYQYEALCRSSGSIQGYGEIERRLDMLRGPDYEEYYRWNDKRIAQSLLNGQSPWVEFKAYLDQCEAEAEADETDDSESREQQDRAIPAVFEDQETLLQWIDILASKGLLFLSAVLRMDADQRRDFLVRTYYPQKVKHFCLMRNMFWAIPFDVLALDDAFSYSDRLEDISGPNLAWLRLNVFDDWIAPASADPEFGADLRKTGYVFWNADRIRALNLDNAEYLVKLMEDCCADCLDNWDAMTGEERIVICCEPGQTFHDSAWIRACAPYMTPKETPLVVEFGILSERWRVAEEADARGEPRFPDIVDMVY